MKVPKEINKLLSNKYVLYVVAFLSLTNVIAYLVAQDYNSLLFFAIIGYLVSYFSKNMTIILLCALIITNLLMTAKSIQNNSVMQMSREGMENMKVNIDTSDPSSGDMTGIKTGDKPDDEKEKKKKAQMAAAAAAAKGSEPMPSEEQTKKAGTKAMNSSQPAAPVGKEDFNIAALKDGLDKSMENMSPNKLNEMNQEAGALLASQQQLAENLKTMGPLLSTAKEMMDTLSGSEGMINKLGMLGGLM